MATAENNSIYDAFYKGKPWNLDIRIYQGIMSKAYNYLELAGDSNSNNDHKKDTGLEQGSKY